MPPVGWRPSRATLAKLSKAQKRAWKKYYKSRVAAIRRSKKKRSEALRAAHRDPVKHKRMAEGSAKALRTRKARRRNSQAQKKVWTDPAYRERQSKAHRKYFRNHPEAKERTSEGGKKLWRDKKFVRKHARIHRALMLKRWETEEWARKVFKRPSKPQLSLFHRVRVKEKGWKLEYPVKHAKGTYWIDIAHPRKQIAIEVDGKHWHKDRARGDAVRDKFLRSKGWKVIRVDAAKIDEFILPEDIQ